MYVELRIRSSSLAHHRPLRTMQLFPCTRSPSSSPSYEVDHLHSLTFILCLRHKMFRAILHQDQHSCIWTPQSRVRKSSLLPDRHSLIWTQHRTTDGGLISFVTRNVSPSRFLPVSDKCSTFTHVSCSVQVSSLSRVSCSVQVFLILTQQVPPVLGCPYPPRPSVFSLDKLYLVLGRLCSHLTSLTWPRPSLLSHGKCPLVHGRLYSHSH